MLTPEKAEILLGIADYLEQQVQPDTFDMSRWTTGTVNAEHPCGTTACALGHATIPYPEYFRLEPGEFTPDTGAWLEIKFSNSWRYATYTIVAIFFGITLQDADHLFFAPVRTIEDQVKVMREFVAKHTKPQEAA